MTELPPGWALATVGDVCHINPRSFDQLLGDDELVSKVPMAAVEAETGRLDPSQLVRYGSAKRKSLTPFQENDVLFAKVTPCMENGKIALARGLHGGRAVGSTELFALRSKGAIRPDYLTYFLLQSSVRKEAERAMTGAVGLRRVPRSFLSSFQIPLPPLVEQQRIVASLEAHLSHLAAGASSIKRADQLCESLSQMIADAELEKLADHEATPLGELLREPLRNGHSARAVNDLGGVRTLTLSAVTRRNFSEEFTKITSANRAKVKDLWLRPGDILIERSNTPDLVGTSALYNGLNDWAIYPDLVIRVRVNDDVFPGYVALVLSTSRIREFYRRSSRGLAGSMPKIDQSVIARTPIPVPSLKEQRKIVTEVEGRRAELSRLDGAVRSSYLHARELREALFLSAFSGELVPQDPADEPTPVLLERIRVESLAPKQGKRTPRIRARQEEANL